jgi:hypothetical protein
LHNLVREAEFWASPDFSRNTFGGFPDVLRSAEERFVDLYRSQLRPFEAEYAVAPGVVVRRTGGHTRGHSMVRLASGGDRLTFLGDAVFPNHFDRPDWHNRFRPRPRGGGPRPGPSLARAGGDPRAAGGRSLVVPSVGRVAVAGDVFRFVPATREH